ncbi:hypothetical protein OYT88_06605 [Sporolactobacillus sp. CQH2019]|uniref:hypothetical protein n=1 Tax=Sporolactobacillus sp. CQH2019 TaxID=3023512 RepID=UPI00236848DA|nr:hypothetical protein [Sporolactobacillus sp. CQH2019]MDD9148216.1 hypothetical protein [Sporolactobacillus sp. CQH2019]
MRAVIVLYNRDMHSSLTLKSLQHIDGRFKKKINIDIYDNSPEPAGIDYKECLSGFKSVAYKSDVRNSGLAAAYNYTLGRCGKEDRWLLLMDQDTRITDLFFESIGRLTENNALDENIAAIVPDIFNERGDFIVPVKVSKILGRYSFFKPDNHLISGEVRTINSCSLINVRFLHEIGGFNNAFQLDCLDHWLFHTIYQKKKRVYLTHDRIVHELSINNTDIYVSEERYKSILDAEQLFYRTYTSKMNYGFYKVRLMKRAVKQKLKVKNQRIFKMTLNRIFGGRP